METKLSKLLAMIDSGDWLAAIKFAAKFPQLGKQADAIIRAKEAINNPDFYHQIKKDPDELIALGIAAIQQRFLKE
jgi:hypothetical protein